MGLKLLVYIVKTALTARVVQLAKTLGAPGATILNGHGTGIKEARSFFGLELNVSTDVVIFLVDQEQVDLIMTSIAEELQLDKPGTGIAFSMAVEKVLGLRLPGQTGGSE